VEDGDAAQVGVDLNAPAGEAAQELPLRHGNDEH
jgi:hypothetical protein